MNNNNMFCNFGQNNNDPFMKYAREIVQEQINDLQIMIVNVTLDKSTALNGGHGLFTTQGVPTNTYFKLQMSTANDQYDLGKYINDLAYTEDQPYTLDKVIEKTNILTVTYYDYLSMFTGQLEPTLFKSIKEIKAGDELSRTYGPPFWLDHDFWRMRPECKWRQTGLDEDLPNDYVAIGEMRTTQYLTDPTSNAGNGSFILCGKRVGNKYYYKASSSFKKKYLGDEWVDMSNDDNSMLYPDVGIVRRWSNGYQKFYRRSFLDANKIKGMEGYDTETNKVIYLAESEYNAEDNDEDNDDLAEFKINNGYNTEDNVEDNDYMLRSEESELKINNGYNASNNMENVEPSIIYPEHIRFYNANGDMKIIESFMLNPEKHDVHIHLCPRFIDEIYKNMNGNITEQEYRTMERYKADTYYSELLDNIDYVSLLQKYKNMLTEDVVHELFWLLCSRSDTAVQYLLDNYMNPKLLAMGRKLLLDRWADLSVKVMNVLYPLYTLSDDDHFKLFEKCNSNDDELNWFLNKCTTFNFSPYVTQLCCHDISCTNYSTIKTLSKVCPTFLADIDPFEICFALFIEGSSIGVDDEEGQDNAWLTYMNKLLEFIPLDKIIDGLHLENGVILKNFEEYGCGMYKEESSLWLKQMVKLTETSQETANEQSINTTL